MNQFPSSTFFSVPPDWGWYIVFYFFFGGLAGGCYFLAVLIDFFGRPEDRPLARLGYYISFPCIVISGLLLTLDLTRPERFWRPLIEVSTTPSAWSSRSAHENESRPPTSSKAS